MFGRLFLILVFLFPINVFAEDEKATEKPVDDHHPVIVITGPHAHKTLPESGKPVSILFGKEFQRNKKTSLGDTLAKEPGISSSSFSPAASRPIIRGQGGERVRVLENGLGSGDVSGISDDHATTADPAFADRIEVLRGSSTLLYGSSAIGGAVNVIDEAIAEKNLNVPFTGELDLRGGDSADDEAFGSGKIAGQAGDVNWFLSGFYRETDDIEIPGYAESSILRESEEHEDEHGDEEHSEEEHEEDEHEEEIKGKLNNSDTRSKGVKAGLSHVWDDGFVGASVKFYDNKYGVPGHSHGHEDEDEHGHDEEGEGHEAEDHDEDHHDEHERVLHEEEEGGPRIDLEQFRAGLRGDFDPNSDTLRTVKYSFAYGDYEHKELEGDEVASTFKSDSFEGRMEFLHQEFAGLIGAAGFQFLYDDFKASGEEAYVPSAESVLPGIFIVEEAKVAEDLVLEFGGRYEYASRDPETASAETFNLLSGTAGLNWKPFGRDYTFSLLGSYAERAPTIAELFANGAHIAQQAFEVGNSTLDKEQSFGTELVLRKNTGDVTGSISAFWQHYFDYISLNPTGGMEDGFDVFNYESTEARFIGFEADATYHVIKSGKHHVDLHGTVEYVEAKNTDDSTWLPRIPPLKGTVGLEYSYDNLSALIEGVFADSQSKTATNELRTDGYTTLNADLSYKIPYEDKQLELYIKGVNLTDEEVRLHTSFLKDIAPLRGRAAFVGVRALF